MVASNIGLAEPFSVAVMLVTPVAAAVVIVGAAWVAKERTEPNEIPTELEAMAQKEYVFPGARPEMFCK